MPTSLFGNNTVLITVIFFVFKYLQKIFQISPVTVLTAVIIQQNIHKGHPIPRPDGRGMGCPVWAIYKVPILCEFSIMCPVLCELSIMPTSPSKSNPVRVPKNTGNFFFLNTHKRHSIARPHGWAMEYLLWVYSLIYILRLSVLCFMWYRVMIHDVIISIVSYRLTSFTFKSSINHIYHHNTT